VQAPASGASDEDVAAAKKGSMLLFRGQPVGMIVASSRREVGDESQLWDPISRGNILHFLSSFAYTCCCLFDLPMCVRLPFFGGAVGRDEEGG
jgi:hypothetical protein